MVPPDAHRGVRCGDLEPFAIPLHHLAGDHTGQTTAHAQCETGLGRTAEAEIRDIDQTVGRDGHSSVVGKKQLQLAGGIGADLVFFVQRVFKPERRTLVSALDKSPGRHGDHARRFGGLG